MIDNSVDSKVHDHGFDPPSGPMSWTEERTELLIKLKEGSNHTRLEMAEAINERTGSQFTLSAISSRLDRSFPPRYPRRTPEEKAAIIRAQRDRHNAARREETRQKRIAAGLSPEFVRPRKSKSESALKVVFRAEEVTAENIHGLMGLEDHHCRFALNDDMASPVWCGGQVVKGKSWCFAHCAVVFAPLMERRRTAA